jgi:hypothetical protein
VAVGVPLFSQCNMAWRSFLQPRGSGLKVLIPLCALFLALASQQGF